MVHSSWRLGAEEITWFLYLPGGLAFSFVQICVQVFMCVFCVQHPAVLGGMSVLQLWCQALLSVHWQRKQPSVLYLTLLALGLLWCVISPQFRSVGVSSLEHTNFSPPSCIAIVGAQLMYALVQFLFITMSEYSLPLGDTLECGDLGCDFGSHSSSA